MKATIYDPLRKKHVAVTPEEQVRQKMIEFLHTKCKWPLGLMNSEVEISLSDVNSSFTSETKYRCDIVCYDKNVVPQIVVECKAPDIKITQKTFNQIWKYAIILKTNWVIVTNGVNTYCCKLNKEKNIFEFVNQFPRYTTTEIDGE